MHTDKERDNSKSSAVGSKNKPACCYFFRRLFFCIDGDDDDGFNYEEVDENTDTLSTKQSVHSSHTKLIDKQESHSKNYNSCTPNPSQADPPVSEDDVILTDDDIVFTETTKARSAPKAQKPVRASSFALSKSKGNQENDMPKGLSTSKSAIFPVALLAHDDRDKIFHNMARRPSMESIEADQADLDIITCESSVSSETNLLGPVNPADKGKICLVIDLDETLVHSSFEVMDHYNFVIEIDISGEMHPVYCSFRPHVHTFLQAIGPLFECVLFTASVNKYADPVCDRLDPDKSVFRSRLFRESCHFYEQNYVKDLADMGRPMDRIVILDNSPVCYCFQPQNAVPIASWFDDPLDTALLQLIPFFQRLALAEDVTVFLENNIPPAVELINTQDRALVTGVGCTIFTRSN